MVEILPPAYLFIKLVRLTNLNSNADVKLSYLTILYQRYTNYSKHELKWMGQMFISPVAKQTKASYALMTLLSFNLWR